MIWFYLVFFGCLGAALAEHVKLSRYQLMHESTKHMIAVEVRRRTYLDRTGFAEFPMPREERVMVWRFGGLPLWIHSTSIGLPAEMDARIQHVKAHEFDEHFSAEFRADGQLDKATLLSQWATLKI